MRDGAIGGSSAGALSPARDHDRVIEAHDAMRRQPALGEDERRTRSAARGLQRQTAKPAHTHFTAAILGADHAAEMRDGGNGGSSAGALSRRAIAIALPMRTIDARSGRRSARTSGVRRKVDQTDKEKAEK
ncbi:MAG TPA: hypothetical protein VF824_00730 [Thermoanaerobaculia bacterium]|jgi:hypothetical protein